MKQANEPKLNKIERYKRELPPADFSPERVKDWQNVDERCRFYLKNFGLYNNKLRPDLWMIRLRFDGGLITPEALKLLARIARQETARLLLTARGQMELHDLRAGRVLPLWRELKAAGLQTCQVISDNFRGIVIDPLDGLASDNRIECLSILQEIRERVVGKREWIGTLPRKFNTALIGREAPSFNPWGNDLLLALARDGDRWGFNLYLGGKNSETAREADIFCPPESAADLFEAVAKVYREHGPRGSRSKTRLFHLIEEVGMPQIRVWIEEESGTPLPRAGELRMQSSHRNRDHLLPIRRYGRHGEISPEELEKAVQEAQSHEHTLRLTPHQELWAFDPDLVHQEIQNPKSKIPNHASTGSVTACAGSRYCPLSLWDIKEDLALLPLGRLEKLGVSLGFSGCLKGCGRHYHSDLGLIGLRTNLYAETERAARIFLGALQAPEPMPARMLYYSVPLRRLGELLHTILDDYEASDRADFETFSREVLARYSIETLQLWYLVRQLHELPNNLVELFYAGDEFVLLSKIDELPDMPQNPELYEKIKQLSHRLWDLV
ncbi:nitrite/sulfite reductase [Nitratifractor salsuginis]|uniref:Nitrite/sulfite reductase hemoprotein beta-component ferrodoxin domain protein n=1 Tax=Nitratifractor salsuginis (strain DSM 16511 / JCM 12458 / E9I37-1) TaxID=749222 RepID=E6X0T1_NITSE|nr:nitrite/sulfite reductase [Nitratifractor salsuginis]ADV46863.1 nitrite/sulfite reductase hemoprotein beta-component ferrodoxin domain protein [Nitratifractor salsuginis DSM 16511]